MYDTITIVEQPIFTRQLVELVDDETYRNFQLELVRRPEQWPIVPGTGGLRKARMRLARRGKSGSARVLYLWVSNHTTVCLYLIYTKGDIENVPASELKTIRHEVQRIKKAFGEIDRIR
jgi:hypothetical protein